MNISLLNKLDRLIDRFEQLELLLSDNALMNDMEQYKQVTKEYSSLSSISIEYSKYKKLLTELKDLDLLVQQDEFRELAVSEISVLQKQQEQQINLLKTLLIPKDENDERDIFMEIRAGTGGEESSLFANDLLRMYMRFAERNNWTVEFISSSETELKGYKEVIIKIIGKNVYSYLKFESGGHRVQRVPVTESQGRIHTSACTVAVMPIADEVKTVELNNADLKIDTYRASGAGGQHINKTDSAIRITHLPTGVVVECQDDRSQHRNKAKALTLLSTKLYNLELDKQNANISNTRKLLIGSGDRSQRIRTYNFPQGRITDHRINLTLYKLEYVLDGDLMDIINALMQEDQAEQLLMMEE